MEEMDPGDAVIGAAWVNGYERRPYALSRRSRLEDIAKSGEYMDKNAVISVSSSVLVVLVLTLLTRSRQAEAPRSEGGFVLGYSQMWKRLTQAMFLFPLCIAIICMVSPPKPKDWWLPYAIIGGTLAILVPLAMEVFRRQVRVDDSGVHNFSAFGEPLFVAWKDVADVRFAPSGEMDIHSMWGQRIRISLFLSGLGSLSAAMSKHLTHVPGIQTVCQRIRA